MELYNLTGQRLETYELGIGNNVVTTDLSEGFYLHHIMVAGELLSTGKILVTR